MNHDVGSGKHCTRSGARQTQLAVWGIGCSGLADSVSRGRSDATYETTSLRSISLVPFSPIARRADLVSDRGSRQSEAGIPARLRTARTAARTSRGPTTVRQVSVSVVSHRFCRSHRRSDPHHCVVSSASRGPTGPQGRIPFVNEFAYALAAEFQKIRYAVHAADGRAPPEVVQNPVRVFAGLYRHGPTCRRSGRRYRRARLPGLALRGWRMRPVKTNARRRKHPMLRKRSQFVGPRAQAALRATRPP